MKKKSTEQNTEHFSTWLENAAPNLIQKQQDLIQKLKQEKVKLLTRWYKHCIISCGLSWQKLLQRFEHTSPIHVSECDEMVTEYISCSCIWLCSLFWMGSLQCIRATRSTCRRFWVGSSPPAKSLSVLVSTWIHTHIPSTHPFCMLAVACCSALL